MYGGQRGGDHNGSVKPPPPSPTKVFDREGDSAVTSEYKVTHTVAVIAILYYSSQCCEKWTSAVRCFVVL